jgi:hypothetical protein
LDKNQYYWRRPKQGTSSSSSRDKAPATKTSTASDTSKGIKQKNRKSRFSATPRGYDKLVAPYNEPPILVPGSSTQPKNKTSLPTIHVDALLDPKAYCRRTAFRGGAPPTKSGPAAMKRLLQGKNHALKVLRREVHRPGFSRKRSPYACVGHGVPRQLLQDHINLAESLLLYHDGAAEISCRNVGGGVSFDW